MGRKHLKKYQETLDMEGYRDRYEYFSTLPYKMKPYARRDWGHPFHFMCSYQSKLKPSIAHFLVDLFTEPNQVVLDPFSGVGTIPFEACSQGRKGVGLDINPIAYYNTQAKVDPPSIEEVCNQIEELRNHIETRGGERELLSQVDDYTKRFYHPNTLVEILKAKDFFLEKRESKQYSLLVACLLHILHGNRPYALSRRSHGLTPLAPSGEFVYKSLIAKLGEKVERVFSEPLPQTFVNGEARQGSVFDLPFTDNSISCIITSPPFVNSTRFFANNRIRLWFCGWDNGKQNEMSDEFIENKQSNNVGVYEDVFSEFHRVLSDDSLCLLHLGVVRNIDMGKKLLPLAEKRGFEKVNVIYEDTSGLESHGMTDQGVTRKHQFMFLRRD